MPRGRPKGGKNRKYEYEFKLKVIKDYFENHLSKKETMTKYLISAGTIEVWKRNNLDGCLEN